MDNLFSNIVWLAFFWLFKARMVCPQKKNVNWYSTARVYFPIQRVFNPFKRRFQPVVV